MIKKYEYLWRYCVKDDTFFITKILSKKYERDIGYLKIYFLSFYKNLIEL